MVRKARLFAPHIPHLIRIVFKRPLSQYLPDGALQADCKNKMLQWVTMLSIQHHVLLHAWRIHEEGLLLLITPSHKKDLSAMIQGLGRYLSAYVGASIFQDRFQSTLLEPRQWVVPAMVWIESYDWQGVHQDEIDLSPWSSAGVHVGHRQGVDQKVSEHADYWDLGNTPFDRQTNYQVLLKEGLSFARQQNLEHALKGQWGLGTDAFLGRLSLMVSRPVQAKPRGRPKKMGIK